MKKKIYPITILLALAAFSLSSCLKDSKYYVNLANSKPLIELPLAAYGTGFFQAEAYNISTTPTNLTVVVNIAAPKPLTTATTVTLALDPDDLAAYNTANGTTYTILPPADYSVSSWTVTIPALDNQEPLNIKINTNLIDPSQQYILPIKISNGGGLQISNYGYILFNVQVKNQYDGEYTVTGTMTDVTSASLTGAYPIDADLITQTGTSDAMYSVTYGNFYHDILSSGSSNVYGEFAPIFNFSATNAITSVVNYYGQPAADTRSAEIDPTGVNASTGTPGTSGYSFQVKYIMVQANDGGPRTFFNETWTYKGPR